MFSIMVVCDASATVGCDRRTLGLSNAPLNIDCDASDTVGCDRRNNGSPMQHSTLTEITKTKHDI